MGLTDWYSVGQHCRTVRILHTASLQELGQVVLAADQPGTTISGSVAIRRDEITEVAELFVGGHNGWFKQVTSSTAVNARFV